MCKVECVQKLEEEEEEVKSCEFDIFAKETLALTLSLFLRRQKRLTSVSLPKRGENSTFVTITGRIVKEVTVHNAIQLT